MEASRAALQNEFDQLATELEASQTSVEQLERKVMEEGGRRQEELTTCAGVIRDLQQQLSTSEERWNSSRDEVFTMTSS